MQNPTDDTELFEIALRHLTGVNASATTVDFLRNNQADHEIRTRILQLGLACSDDDITLVQKILYHRVQAYVLAWQLETVHLMKM